MHSSGPDCPCSAFQGQKFHQKKWHMVPILQETSAHTRACPFLVIFCILSPCSVPSSLFFQAGGGGCKGPSLLAIFPQGCEGKFLCSQLHCTRDWGGGLHILENCVRVMSAAPWFKAVTEFYVWLSTCQTSADIKRIFSVTDRYIYIAYIACARRELLRCRLSLL